MSFSRWALLVSGVLLLPASFAQARNCKDLLELELTLNDPMLLSHGALVGTLSFEDVGENDCVVGGIMSISSETLFYELETPSGKSVRLSRLNFADRMTVQHAHLFPGEIVKHPVCLLKVYKNYLFVESGQYRIRAAFMVEFPIEVAEPISGLNTQGIPQEQPNHPDSSAATWIKSNWVNFSVLEAGKGWRNICHPIPPGTCTKQTRSPETIQQAEAMLTLAERANLGKDVWTWIVGRLKEFPLDCKGKNCTDSSGGFYF